MRQLVTLHLATSVPDGSMRRVLHHNDKTAPDELADDRKQLDAKMQPVMQVAFAQAGIQPLTEIVPVSDSGLDRIGYDVDASTFSRLQVEHPADAYLRWRVTDYGETPVRWKGSYVAFEVVTTLAIAGAFYTHAVTRPVAGIYLLQESAEELAEGYAGFWTLNRLSRPVRIEADLIDGHSGEVLWRASDTGLAQWQWRHLWHMDDHTRDALLATSTWKAAEAITQSLAGFLAADCGSHARNKKPCQSRVLGVFGTHA